MIAHAGDNNEAILAEFASSLILYDFYLYTFELILFCCSYSVKWDRYFDVWNVISPSLYQTQTDLSTSRSTQVNTGYSV